MTSKESLRKTTSDYFAIQNRRYIGNKFKIINWIFDAIKKECSGNSFFDIFSGTGVVAAEACNRFDKVILNDFLHSNHVIYNAFFSNEKIDEKKINNYLEKYNRLNVTDDNYFSLNFGGLFFDLKSSRNIGYIREDIEKNKNTLNLKEYSYLLTSLIYATDRIANTVGHFDAFIKKERSNNNLILKPLLLIKNRKVDIYKEDANQLAPKIKADIAYIDPPYNSRQYSRFYHVYETLIKWDKPELFGVARKPETENSSDYCKVGAPNALADLIENIKTSYTVISYNNTYNSKSSSSKNKITFDEIEEILKNKGKTKILKTSYQHFNAGNTNFDDHNEYLFITKVKK